MDIETPHLTVDCVIRVDGGIVLIRRKNPPYQGCYALPGGFVDIGETTEAACRREVLEETGLALGDLSLVGVYSDPSRDSRGHVVSITYYAESDGNGLRAGDDAAGVEVVEDTGDVDLAFDHDRIIADALKRYGTWQHRSNRMD